MASLRDQFQHFYAPDEDAIATAIRTGLVTPDANVLLSLYRFQREARDQLFGALEKLSERLWIPHQVALEFHQNRLNVMHEQQEFFSRTEQELDKLIGDLREKVRAFRGRIALGEDQIAGVEEGIRHLQELLARVVLGAADANVYVREHASDKVLARLEALLGNRVGEPMEKAELEAARKEGKRRVDADLPPGYMDKKKADPTGDYLVWRQLMNEAAKRKLPVVFITDDRKEDWYRRQHGLTFGARRELREEMMAEAGVPLLIMTTETFLLHAEKYLDAEVSPETVDQAKELPTLHNLDIVLSSPMTKEREKLLEALVGREFARQSGESTLEWNLLWNLVESQREKNAPEDAQARREAFVDYLRMPATSTKSSETDIAARYIADFLVSDVSTQEEALHALAWLVEFIGGRRDSPGKPPTELMTPIHLDE